MFRLGQSGLVFSWSGTSAWILSRTTIWWKKRTIKIFLEKLIWEKKHDFSQTVLIWTGRSIKLEPSQKNGVIVREFDVREFQKVVVHVPGWVLVDLFGVILGDTLSAMWLLNKQSKGAGSSSGGSSVARSVELDHFIGPKDCQEILQKTLNQIKGQSKLKFFFIKFTHCSN